LSQLILFPYLELKQAVADETAVKEAAQIVLTTTQAEHADLEQTAMAVC